MSPNICGPRTANGSVETKTDDNPHLHLMPRPQRPSTSRRAPIRKSFRETAGFQMLEALALKLMLSLPDAPAPSRMAFCPAKTHTGIIATDRCCVPGVNDNRLCSCSNAHIADSQAVSHESSSCNTDPDSTYGSSTRLDESAQVARHHSLDSTAEHGSIHRLPKTMAGGLKQVAAVVRRNVSALKYGKQAINWKGDVWDDLENNSMGFNTQDLMISCGTITVKGHPGQPQVLIVFNRELGVFQLPKGKKDINEALPATAVRETVEETGIPVEPLYLKFGTRFTCPEGWQVQRSGELVPGAGEGSRTEPESPVPRVMTKDIIYSSAYVDPATQAFRYIFWYAATPAGDATPDDALRNAEDIRRLQPLWFPVEKAISLLKMTVEKQAVATVRDYIEDMTPQDWVLSRRLAEKDKQTPSEEPSSTGRHPASPAAGSDCPPP